MNREKFQKLFGRMDELAIQKRKVEDDLNDIYHERKKIND